MYGWGSGDKQCPRYRYADNSGDDRHLGRLHRQPPSIQSMFRQIMVDVSRCIDSCPTCSLYFDGDADTASDTDTIASSHGVTLTADTDDHEDSNGT